jgi:hypothetical protein
MTDEVARVISAPRINIGRWCAFIAAVMWYAMNPTSEFLVRLSGGGGLSMLYILVTFGFAIRAGHDLLMWLAQANEALNEKRKFQAMGTSAAIEWAHAQEMREVENGTYKRNPQLTAEIVRKLEEKYGKA